VAAIWQFLLIYGLERKNPVNSLANLCLQLTSIYNYDYEVLDMTILYSALIGNPNIILLDVK